MVERKNIFKERLKQLRLERGLTLEKLGEKISVRKQAVHNLENEAMSTLPSYNVLLDIADALEVSLDYLVGRSDDPKVHQIRKRGDN